MWLRTDHLATPLTHPGPLNCWKAESPYFLPFLSIDLSGRWCFSIQGYLFPNGASVWSTNDWVGSLLGVRPRDSFNCHNEVSWFSCHQLHKTCTFKFPFWVITFFLRPLWHGACVGGLQKETGPGALNHFFYSSAFVVCLGGSHLGDKGVHAALQMGVPSCCLPCLWIFSTLGSAVVLQPAFSIQQIGEEELKVATKISQSQMLKLIWEFQGKMPEEILSKIRSSWSTSSGEGSWVAHPCRRHSNANLHRRKNELGNFWPFPQYESISSIWWNWAQRTMIVTGLGYMLLWLS